MSLFDAVLNRYAQEFTAPVILRASDVDAIFLVDADDNPIFRIDKEGHVIIKASAVPDDAVVEPGEATTWWDATDGAGRLNVKGKTADGTVASFALAGLSDLAGFSADVYAADILPGTASIDISGNATTATKQVYIADFAAHPEGENYATLAPMAGYPEFRWGLGIGTNTVGHGYNPVVGWGYNVNNAATAADPTQPYCRIAMEGNWHNGTDYVFEVHIGEVGIPGGITVRPITMMIEKTTGKTGLSFQGTHFDFLEEGGANPVAQILWDAASGNRNFQFYSGVLATHSLGSTNTSDSMTVGRGTVAAGFVLNGSSNSFSFTNAVNSWQFNHGEGDGQLLLLAPSGVFFYFSPGVGTHNKLMIQNCRTSCGAERFPNDATLDVTPTSTSTSCIILNRIASYAADYIRMVDTDQVTPLGWRLNKNAYPITGKNAAPDDTDLLAGEATTWWDATDGAGRLNVKGKTADGTVASFALAGLSDLAGLIGVVHTTGDETIAGAKTFSGMIAATAGADISGTVTFRDVVEYRGATGTVATTWFTADLATPYDRAAYVGNAGNFSTSAWITVSQKRNNDGGIQGIGQEYSMLALSPDINGPTVQIEANTSSGKYAYAIAIYDLNNIDAVNSPASSYSPGSGVKTWTIGAEGQMAWGTELGQLANSDPWANRKASIALSRTTGMLTFGGDPTTNLASLDLLTPGTPGVGAAQFGIGRHADGSLDLKLKAQSGTASDPSATFELINPSGTRFEAITLVSRDVAGLGSTSLPRFDYADLTGGIKFVAADGVVKSGFDTDGTLCIGAMTNPYKFTLSGAAKNTVFYGLSNAIVAEGDILNYAIVGDATFAGYIYGFNYALNSSSTFFNTLRNVRSSATSHVVMELSVAGAGAGDPFVTYTIAGIRNVTMGLDNSDGDKWKVSHSSNVGDNDLLTVSMTGDVVATGTCESTAFKVAGTQVVGARGAAVADATDAASVITQLNALLARVRAHGLIA